MDQNEHSNETLNQQSGENNHHQRSHEEGVQKSLPKEWGYEGESANWESMYPNANGNHQSPINIDTKLAVQDSQLSHNPLLVWYDNDCFTNIENTGHSFNVSGAANNSSKVSGGPVKDTYKFLQFHMHWGQDESVGSEHTVDGFSYSAEIHFVNWNSDKYYKPEDAVRSTNHDGLLVLGVFVKIGAHNPEFDKLIPSLTDIKYKSQKTKLDQTLVMANLFPADISKYWNYQGSLTTPPCNECVEWVVFNEPIEVSHDQLRAFHRLYETSDPVQASDSSRILHNFRKVCPLNDRKVKKSFN